MKLTFETPVFDAQPQRLNFEPQPSMDHLTKLIWGEEHASHLQVIQTMPHIAMYLTLRLESDTSKEEVIEAFGSVYNVLIKHPYRYFFIAYWKEY